jgi:hypothetical protein
MSVAMMAVDNDDVVLLDIDIGIDIIELPELIIGSE